MNYEDMKQLTTCPITHDSMFDPVVAQDGYTYERRAIEKWFLEQKANDRPTTSPMTNERIDDQLIRNYALRSMLHESHSKLFEKWCEENKDLEPREWHIGVFEYLRPTVQPKTMDEET
jgi:hypothetical protein